MTWQQQNPGGLWYLTVRQSFIHNSLVSSFLTPAERGSSIKSEVQFFPNVIKVRIKAACPPLLESPHVLKM